MPILRESDPQAPIFSTLNLNGIAVATLLVIGSIVAAVWAVDDHFISRREFNLQMSLVSAQLQAIHKRLGILPPPPLTVTPGSEEP